MFGTTTLERLAAAVDRLIVENGGSRPSDTAGALARALGYPDRESYTLAERRATREMRSWRIGEGAAEDELEPHERGPYTLTIEDNGRQQFEARIVPQGVDKTRPWTAGGHMLTAFFEINYGVPCVHLSNDPFGEVLLSIFGCEDGLLVRSETRPILDVRHAEGSLARVAREAVGRDGGLVVRNRYERIVPPRGGSRDDWAGEAAEGLARASPDAELGERRRGSLAERAIEIADRAMLELLRSETVPCQPGELAVGHRFGLANARGTEVGCMAEAGDGAREAYAWLSERGYARLTTDDHGEVVELTALPK